MIVRAGALILLLYAIAFVLFAVTLGRPASASEPRTDAVVVITGSSGRIAQGVAALEAGKARRMLIAGADPSVTRRDLVRSLHVNRRLAACCVDLGSESVDTRSNAEEAQRWLAVHGYKSYRLITSDWHMRRASYEFHKVLSSSYRQVPDAVRSEPSFLTLFGEYNKYVLRRLAVWLDI
jgi:uncharacterized SAM-binding protein YcdF (DUF218 family)